jgi:hypothetical protein
VHPTYVQYVKGSADQDLYVTTSGQIPHTVCTVGETGTLYTTAAIYTYSQVASNSARGNSAGQLLARGNGAYVIKQGVDPDAAHTLTAVRTDSPQTVIVDGGGVAYMVPEIQLLTLLLWIVWDVLTSHTTRTWLATFQCRSS